MKRVGAKSLRSFFVNPKACAAGLFAAVIFCVMSSFAGPVFAEDVIGEPRWHTVHMRVTAYCPCAKCCGEWSDGVTATGHKIFQGDRFAAADRRYAPKAMQTRKSNPKSAANVPLSDESAAAMRRSIAAMRSRKLLSFFTL